MTAQQDEEYDLLYTKWVKTVSRRFGKPPGHPVRERVNDNAPEDEKRAIRFSGIGVEPYEINLFAYVMTGLLTVVMLVIGAIFLIVMDMDETVKESELFPAVIVVIIACTIGPFFILMFLANYPKTAAERVKIQSLGRMPEVINYLVMSMRLTPSLNKAIAFAAENVEEPMGSALKKVLWDVYMRKYDSIEEAFLGFAYDWGSWNDDFKRSLYAVRSSELEKTKEGIDRGLEKASDIILSGTKRRMDIFVGSLSTPTFVLFAIGILMPMILGAMLPMMSMGGMTLKIYQVVALMNIVFPLAALGYSFMILGKRPGTSTPPRIKSRLTSLQKKSIATTAIMMSAALFALGFISTAMIDPKNNDPVVVQARMLGSLPYVWAVGFPLSYYCLLTSRDQKKRRDEVKQMEEEFPDALFQLGSRIAEGLPLEVALEKTSETMKGTLVADIFRRTAYILQITRTTLEEALFGSMGVLRDHPSRAIKATMKTVTETVKKDAITAGATIIGISNYLRDMTKVDHDIRTQLNSVMDMMKTTASMFGPIVMGITSALFVILKNAMSQINLTGTGGAGGLFGGTPSGKIEMIDPSQFSFVMGLYLLMIVVIIIYFTAGITHGEDWLERKYLIGTSMPVALTIYSIALFGGTTILGAGGMS